MNAEYQGPLVSTKEVYNLDVIPIPDDMEAYAFRPPKFGDSYLSTTDAMRGGKTFSVAAGDFVSPRILLRKKSKQIRVVRVLEYTGPEDWIKSTMANNGIGPHGPQIPANRRSSLGAVTPQMSPDRNIRELSVFQEEISCQN